MPSVVELDALGEKALAASLPPSGQGSTSALATHARAESVLALASAFGWLEGTFHGAARSAILRNKGGLSTGGGTNPNCQSGLFLK
jgi:hypothetical protein